MRNWLKVGLVGAVAALTVGATSSVAYAGDTQNAKCWVANDDKGGVDCRVEFFNNSNYAGWAWFYAYGEHLYAEDGRADGLGIYMAARWHDSSTGLNHFYDYWLTSGAGTTHDSNLSMPEGTSVTFTACQTNNGSLYNCRNETAIA